MTKTNSERFDMRQTLSVFDLPEGYVEYQAAEAIRNLIHVYGFGGASQKVAELLMSEAERRK